jgi:predicted lipid-binding transport protein (Tim44 family)
MPPQRNSWWGPIAGFAGGALLGSLFFGHGGFGGGGGGGFLGILLFGLVGVVLVMVIRRFLVAAPPAQELYTPAPRYPDPAPMTSMNTGGRPPLALPPGFDLEAFIHQAKVAYIRLQAANDAGDLNDLRAFTTPEMFAEISLEIQARHGAPQRVEVLQLDAELLDLSQQGTVALATVQYFVTAREDGGVPESYTELWHVRKLLADSHSSWLLAGIEQI